MSCHGCLKAAAGGKRCGNGLVGIRHRLNLNIAPQPKLAPAAGAKRRRKVIINLNYKSVQHASYVAF